MNDQVIDLWKIEILTETKALQNYFRLLSKDEKDKSRKFRFKKDKHEYVISRGFLRIVLSSYTDLFPEILNISYGPFGKPYLTEEYAKLKFNLSHSYGITMIAVNKDNEVGIDIEKVKNLEDQFGLAKKYYTENEIKLLNSESQFQTNVFYKIWTRKEAIIKTVGKGLSIPLNLIDVSDPANILYDSSSDLTGTEFNKCKLYNVDAPDGYEAAVACVGEKKEIAYKNL